MHPIIREPFTEFISQNVPDSSGVLCLATTLKQYKQRQSRSDIVINVTVTVNTTITSYRLFLA